MQGLSYECKIDQANFTYWMSFLSSNLVEEINRNPETQRKYLNQN